MAARDRVLRPDATGQSQELTVFVALRRSLRVILDQPEMRLRPSQRLEDVLPRQRRCALWSRWSDETAVVFPDLVSPPRLRRALFFSGLLMSVISLTVGLVFTTSPDRRSWSVMANAVIDLLFPWLLLPGIGLLIASRNLCASSFPEGLTTVRDLVREVIPREWKRHDPRPADEEILHRLKPILCRILSAAPNDVVPEARLVEDLGCE